MGLRLSGWMGAGLNHAGRKVARAVATEGGETPGSQVILCGAEFVRYCSHCSLNATNAKAS
jgi:hypothetical protein